MKGRLLITVGSARFFLTHRLPVARGARSAGYDVHVVAPASPELAEIRAQGFAVHHLPLLRKSLAPWREAWTLWRLFRLYRDLRPDVVHQVALKPILYGTIAARLSGVPAVVNAVTGLGHLFVESGRQTRILRAAFSALARPALRHAHSRFIFQNPDDLALFVRLRLTTESESVLIRGSGVDTSVFVPTPEPDGPPVVVLPSRMLRHKGVAEFVEAARVLRGAGATARFALVGAPDLDNPESIPVAQLEQWHREGAVEWWGHREDMPAVFAASHVVALPSFYREGVPKVLIEAAACGRPIVTTDMPGCREIVEDGVNGLLVPPHDPAALAAALLRLLEDKELRTESGMRGRQRVERAFDVGLVVRETLRVYGQLGVQPSHPGGDQ